MRETTIIAKPRQKLLAQRLMEKRIADHERKVQAKADWIREQAERENAKPTPQRIAKKDIESRHHEDSNGMRYQPKQDVLKQYKGEWLPEMEVAFYRLADDAQAASVSNVTMNYERSGGGSAGSRIGGMGAAHAEQITRFHRFNWIMDRLTPRSRRVIEFLLLGSRDGTVSPATLREVGLWVFPHITDKTSSKMIGLGRFLGCGDELVKLYGDFDLGQRFHEVRTRLVSVNA
jgi:hypothetical protein